MAATSDESEQENVIKRVGFDLNSLIQTHRSIAHAIEWRFAYQLTDHIGFSIGSLHVVTGENVIKHNTLVAKINGYF